MKKKTGKNIKRHSEAVSKILHRFTVLNDDTAEESVKTDYVPAITLAEIMIVVVIVAVIALVFMAMPKKNVGKMDRAKYYIAYNMLKRMQDEQMAETGKVAINADNNNDGIITDCSDECFDAETRNKTSANNDKTNIVSSFTSDSYGFVYGNGTNNAVLGYAVKNGSASTIETAQMK